MKRLRQAGVAWSRPEGTRCYVSLRPDLERRFPGLLATILAAEGDAHEVRPGHATGSGPVRPGQATGLRPART
jgi:hypothetical protein